MTRAGAPEDDFSKERARLLGLGYRIMGSLADAEDVVQEAWLRWSAADRDAIEKPAAWLTTVTTRLALDKLKSAHRRRETYVGPWLPEPVLTSPGPEEVAETAETLTLGFLAMLEQLDPVSRVVFLLTDVFGYSSNEVSDAVGRTPPACRQIASRARKKLHGAQPHRPSATDRAVADRLLAAIAGGDTDTAMALMSQDVVLVTDGGPNRHAARRPVVGPWRVNRFLANISKRVSPTVGIEAVTINGAAGFRLRDPAGEQDAAMAFDLTDGVVSAIWVVTNPEKLTRINTPVILA
ncbi:MAG TPA: RNA polymerase sigma factor SigJ [Acidimicrobiales bacterium]|nr:RNA polymerase sigma factor SigJ [Acidimicrobiales bacterium]